MSINWITTSTSPYKDGETNLGKLIPGGQTQAPSHTSLEPRFIWGNQFLEVKHLPSQPRFEPGVFA